MGASNGKALESEEINSISRETGFTAGQIKRLFNRFSALDKGDSGFLGRQDFLMIPELVINPLCDRIVNEFFKDCRNDELNFRDFTKILARFRKVDRHDPEETKPLADRRSKLYFLFGMYDLDCDGRITRDELMKMLQMMVGQNITKDQMANIGSRTMLEADTDSDGAISFEEFICAFENIDVEQKMSIKFLE